MITDIRVDNTASAGRVVVVTETLNESDLTGMEGAIPRVGDTLIRKVIHVDESRARALLEFVRDIADNGLWRNQQREASLSNQSPSIKAMLDYLDLINRAHQQRAGDALRNPAGPLRDTVLEAACAAWWGVEVGTPWGEEQMRVCDCPGPCEEFGGAICAGIKARNECRTHVRNLLNAGALDTAAERKARALGPCRGDVVALEVGLTLWGLAGAREERQEITPGRIPFGDLAGQTARFNVSPNDIGVDMGHYVTLNEDLASVRRADRIGERLGTVVRVNGDGTVDVRLGGTE